MIKPLFDTGTPLILPDGYKIALIYDDQVRSDTPGGYCFDFLKTITQVDHFLPGALNTINPSRYDLYINVDDGFNYTLPDALFPRAWWVIDTHLNFDWDLHKANFFDWVFTAQKDAAIRFREAGVKNTWWLPLAGNPAMRKEEDVKTYSWAFVGNTGSGIFSERDRILKQARTLEGYFAGKATPAEMYGIYGQSECVLNPPIRNDINMRVFEAMASGSILVTRKLSENGMDDLFIEGVHYLSFEGEEDVASALMAAVTLPADKKAEIREEAKQLADERDSYAHRMRALLRQVLSTPGYQPRYFMHVRQEIAAEVPLEARTILDIGCGAGALGGFLKERGSCQVHGIEYSPRAAEVAKDVLDQVFVGDAMEILPTLADEFYDVVVLADVLEHLPEPKQCLDLVRKKVKSNGMVVVSLPNAAHWSLVVPLLQGDFTYQDAGILDKTHLRFFTPMTASRLLDASGFSVRDVKGAVLEPEANLQQHIKSDFSPLWQQWANNLANIYQIVMVGVPG